MWCVIVLLQDAFDDRVPHPMGNLQTPRGKVDRPTDVQLEQAADWLRLKAGPDNICKKHGLVNGNPIL